MRKKDIVLSAMAKILVRSGCTIQDLCRHEGGVFVDLSEADGNNMQFSFDVLYENKKISRWKLAGVKPLGIILVGKLIHLHDAPGKYSWEAGQDYCRKLDLPGFSLQTTMGEEAFWTKAIAPNADRLNILLLRLGGDPIDLDEKYWTATEFVSNAAYYFSGQDEDERTEFYKGMKHRVRPISDFE